LKIWFFLYLFFSKIYTLPFFERVSEDFDSYFRITSLFTLDIAFSLGGVMANTPIDESLQYLYQTHIRSNDTDAFLTFWKQFGQNEVLAVYAAIGIAGFTLQSPFTEQLFNKCCRAFIVGTIPLYVMRVLTGGSRPVDEGETSNWKPFTKLHGVSGHTYTGAVLFITLAKMTNHFLLKYLFYGASTLTGISRINSDKHYTSQVLLGWIMAYVACDAIDFTDSKYYLSTNNGKISFGFEF
jgi:membrane-associated phospholipid phosphatase